MAERLQILLIEDDPDHATLIRRNLARADHQFQIEIEHVVRLSDGIRRIHEHEALDAVLCDLSLPDSSVAAETVESIIAACTELPVIVLTSLGDVGLATRSVQQGAQDYLVKSEITGPLLLRSIRYAIERKRVERQLKTVNEQLEQRVRDRTLEIVLLQDLAVIANQADSVRTAFGDALERICRQLDLELGQALVINDESADAVMDIGVRFVADERLKKPGTQLLCKPIKPRGRLFRRLIRDRRPAWVDDFLGDTAFEDFAKETDVELRSGLAIPVYVQRRIVAMLEFYSCKDAAPTNELMEALDRIGTQFGRVMERHELEKGIEGRALDEQRRISAELHDGLGHELSGLLFLANSFALQLSDEESPHAATGREIAEGIRTSTRILRSMLKGLTAVDIAEDGLQSALVELANLSQRRTKIHCEVYADDFVLPNRDMAAQLFRIAQEAVNNALKHARATTINILLRETREEITLSVLDDGVGIDSKGESQQTGMGLGIMKHRANVIGGVVYIQRNEVGGTIVTCVCKKNLSRTSVTA
ncbi:MAG: GAF domain-containing protein [Planctomycetota bacterium]|nr:GAF domain-containing protein [Planctomycetota bacterium]